MIAFLLSADAELVTLLFANFTINFRWNALSPPTEMTNSTANNQLRYSLRVKNLFCLSGQDQVWFGGTDQAQEGTWVFTDGTVIDYLGTGWQETGEVGEDCARFTPAPWDINCGQEYKYICMTPPAQGKTKLKISLVSVRSIHGETVILCIRTFTPAYQQTNINTFL